jgi:homoserine kinase
MLDLLGTKLRGRMKNRRVLFRQGRQQQRRANALMENIVGSRKTLLAMCQPADVKHVAAALERRYAKNANFRAAYAQAMPAFD